MNGLDSTGLLTIDDGEGVAGIGSIFKKIGTIALASAGAIAAPFTGGLSAVGASALIGIVGAAGSAGAGLLNSSGGGGVKAANQPSGIPEAIAQWDSQLTQVESQIMNGALDKSTVDAQVETQWHSLHDTVNQLWTIKHHVEQPKAQSYHDSIDAIKDKWNKTVYVAPVAPVTPNGNTGVANPNIPITTVTVNGQQISGQVVNGQFTPINTDMNSNGSLGGLFGGVSTTTLAVGGVAAVATYLLLFSKKGNA